MRNEPTLEGASMPDGSVIFIHLIPSKPCRFAISQATFSTVSYHSSVFASFSACPQRGSQASCQRIISRWNFPYQEFMVRPVSCGGMLPALWMASRYWDSTTRLSNSFALASLQREKSTAAPFVQKLFHVSLDSPATISNDTLLSFAKAATASFPLFPSMNSTENPILFPFGRRM